MTRAPDHSGARRWACWAALVVILLSTAAVRWRLLDVPLERDEGEYAYAGQLILQGSPPYQHVYNKKLPGIYAAYAAVLAAFGETPRGVHLGLLVVNAATIVLVFVLARGLIGNLAAVVAAACFALLAVSQAVLGMSAHAEHFVLLPALGGLLLLRGAADGGRPGSLAWSGLLLGAAFVVKQHGAAFVVLGEVYLLITLLRRRPLEWRQIVSRCGILGLAATIPFLVTCLVLWLAGVFDRFWFWTVTYAWTYVTQLPLDQAWTEFTSATTHVVGGAPLIWALAALGVAGLYWNGRAREQRLFIGLFTLFSFLAICPGFYFRWQYFVLALPAAAVLAGAAVSAAAGLLSHTGRPGLQYGVPLALAALCLAASVTQQRHYLFRQTPAQVARSTYGLNPFPESVDVARFVDASTAPHDRIAVLGSEPQIFFYARRRSATGYIYTYDLMQQHAFALTMQREMIREIEAADPAIVIFVNVATSWLRRLQSYQLIFDWFAAYREKLALVAIAELRPDGARYYWGADLGLLTRRPQFSLEIYTRRE